jgi:hypothetical protein
VQRRDTAGDDGRDPVAAGQAGGRRADPEEAGVGTGGAPPHPVARVHGREDGDEGDEVTPEGPVRDVHRREVDRPLRCSGLPGSRSWWGAEEQR